MKLTPQTIANVFAARLGNNNRRVISVPYNGSNYADFEVPGATIRVNTNQLLTVDFVIPQKDEDALSRQQLAEKYGDPAVTSIKQQFASTAKDYIVSVELPKNRENEAIALHNGLSVRVAAEEVSIGTQYSLQLMLGTFSI